MKNNETFLISRTGTWRVYIEKSLRCMKIKKLTLTGILIFTFCLLWTLIIIYYVVFSEGKEYNCTIVYFTVAEI